MPQYHKVEIVIVNSEQNSKTVHARMNLFDISYYYPGFYEGTVVVMKQGNSFLSPLSVDEWDELIANSNK
jgi:hypothetical protein